MAFIEASGLRREYPPAVVALDDATFTIEQGETVAVCGPSGSGKSTLLAMLGMLDGPTAGSCTLDGLAIEDLRRGERSRIRRSHIGFVFQSFHLIPHLTATENVMVSLDAKRHPRRTQRRTALAELERVGLAHRADAFPATLSGGEQQRVAIARAVAPSPPLLLCDEPTGNLDSRTSAEVLDILLDSASGATVVVVTHDSTVADQCDRTLWVRDGIVHEQPSEVGA